MATCEIKDSTKLILCILSWTKFPITFGYLSTSSQAKNISKNKVKILATKNFISLFIRPLEGWSNTKKSLVKKANKIDNILAMIEDNTAESNIANVVVLVAKYTIVASIPKNIYFTTSENKKFFVCVFI